MHMFDVIDQIESLSLLGKVSMEIANPPDEREMYYIQIAKFPVLQYCVKIMVQILYVSIYYLLLLPLIIIHASS